MKAVPLKNTGDPYTSNEFNTLPSQELQNTVLSSGQALDEFDSEQLAKAMAIYAGAGDFYVDSGVVNAYVLSPINIQKAPPSYTNGLRARFVATNTNSSNSTVNLNGLGTKSIKENGVELVSGRIVAGKIIEIQFLSAGDAFELVPLHPNTSSVMELTTTGDEIIESIIFDENGHVQNVFLRNLDASDIGAGIVDSVVGGDSITVDDTDPANPIVNADAATTSDKGVVEKSTSAENIAGVAVDKFPDVAGVKEIVDNNAATLTRSTGSNGFAKITQGGIDAIMQWGTVNVPSDNTATANFSVSFSGIGFYQITVGAVNTSGTGNQDNMEIRSKSAASAVIVNNSGTTRNALWIAIGT